MKDLVLVGVPVVFFGTSVLGATIDFDGLPAMNFLGTEVPAEAKLSDQLIGSTGARFSTVGGAGFVAVTNLEEGAPRRSAPSAPNGIGGVGSDGVLDYARPVRVTFVNAADPDSPATTDFVSIQGDLRGSDIGKAYLEAYSLSGALLASDSGFDAAAGGSGVLRVSAPGIHYVIASSDDGSVSFDNLVLDEVQELTSRNLLRNGSFEDGNVGFESSYVPYVGGTLDAAMYAVVFDPHAVHSLAASFGDHSSGQGMMLVANGSSNPEDIIWSQTVSVLPNRQYRFSGWGATWGRFPGQDFDPAPPRMVVTVNGQRVGEPIQLLAKNGLWQNFAVVWDSGVETEARVELTLETTAFAGNDLALDDLRLDLLAVEPFASIQVFRSVEIEWVSVPGGRYQVQWASSPDAISWFDLGGETMADDEHTSILDRVIGKENRFYRVLNLE